MTQDKRSVYSRTWDNYVTKSFPDIQNAPARKPGDLREWQVLNTTDDHYTWPGDEWGDADAVARILDTCVAPYLVAPPAHAVEIASGSGRMTRPFLDRFPNAQIGCFDISQAFLDQMHLRFPDEIASGQMTTHLLNDKPGFMYEVIETAGLQGRIDCLFSYDAMVHVELHTVLIYIATAAAVLKPGGLLSMSVADGANPLAFQKMLCNAPSVFRLGGQAGPHFQFMSHDILEYMLPRMGFAFDLHDCNGRDIFFSARLEDPGAARRSFRDAGSNWWLAP